MKVSPKFLLLHKWKEISPDKLKICVLTKLHENRFTCLGCRERFRQQKCFKIALLALGRSKWIFTKKRHLSDHMTFLMLNNM